MCNESYAGGCIATELFYALIPISFTYFLLFCYPYVMLLYKQPSDIKTLIRFWSILLHWRRLTYAWPCHSFCCHTVDPTPPFNVSVPGYSLPTIVFSVCMDCCCILSVPSWASYKLHHYIITWPVYGCDLLRKLKHENVCDHSTKTFTLKNFHYTVLDGPNMLRSYKTAFGHM